MQPRVCFWLHDEDLIGGTICLVIANVALLGIPYVVGQIIDATTGHSQNAVARTIQKKMTNISLEAANKRCYVTDTFCDNFCNLCISKSFLVHSRRFLKQLYYYL